MQDFKPDKHATLFRKIALFGLENPSASRKRAQPNLIYSINGSTPTGPTDLIFALVDVNDGSVIDDFPARPLSRPERFSRCTTGQTRAATKYPCPGHHSVAMMPPVRKRWSTQPILIAPAMLQPSNLDPGYYRQRPTPALGHRSLQSWMPFLLLCALWIFNPIAVADDFTRQSTFVSPEAFVESVKGCALSTAEGLIPKLMAIPDIGQGNHGKIITATKVQSCEVLWAEDTAALVFATANPPTEATRSAVGVIFYLVQKDGKWRIADLLRFTAIGKYAEVTAEQTANAGSGYCLGKDGMEPVVTIKESQGGRGYSYMTSASFTIKAAKLKRVDLE